MTDKICLSNDTTGMTVEMWLGEQNKIGIDIWNNKYCFENETFNEWLDRISNGNIELRQLILEKKFLFGGRILSNRGLFKKYIKTTYSNCYVIAPPEDNIESIFECAQKLARTYSYGGGCGIDISKLAPKGSKVNNTAKKTTGAISFMDLYSLVTGLIGQNGRRGALMISLACDHPDIEEFVELKSDLTRVTKANISVRITNKFMEAVQNDENFVLTFTRPETEDTVTKTVKARELFSKIAKMNWDYAEPGALFWDRICNWNLLSNTEEFVFAGTNPCAEEPLPAGGSCLLGSINLSEFVINPFSDNSKFDHTAFKKAVMISTKALNEVLDEGLPLHPLQEQKDSVTDWRQIGLGIFGLADMLIKLGIEYGSNEAIKLCDVIGKEMINASIQESSNLAEKFGAYPKCKIEEIMDTEFFKYNVTTQKLRDKVKKTGLRNSQLLTIAPTGTLSTMLGVSGGIEPIFANYYERKTESLHGEDVYYKIYTPIVEDYMATYNIRDDKDLPDYFVTAQNLEYRNRIKMQSIFQNHIDASISSTVNVPNDFTEEQTQELYEYAWEKNLKGVTIFRDGCKRAGILTIDSGSDDIDNLPRGYIIEVSNNVIGRKRKLITGCGSLHCTAFFDPKTGNLLETYLSKGSTGGCNNFMIGLSRMISLSARSGCDIKQIVDQLDSCGICSSYAVRTATKRDTSKGSCCPVAVAKALLDMYNEVQKDLGLTIKTPKNKNNLVEVDGSVCPKCGAKLTFEGGCNICKDCGWSKCD